MPVKYFQQVEKELILPKCLIKLLQDIVQENEKVQPSAYVLINAFVTVRKQRRQFAKQFDWHRAGPAFCEMLLTLVLAQ